MIGKDVPRRCGVAGVAVLALVVALAGCGAGVVTDDGLEEQVKSQFAADKVNCPTDLDREVGQSEVCSATRGDETFDVRVTIAAVRGDRASDVELTVERVGGPAATSTATAMSTADSVEEQVRSRLGTDSADCPGDLAAEVGQSMVCTATRGDETFDVRVTVTAVRGNTLDLLLERLGGTAGPTATADGDVSPDPSTVVPGEKVARSVREQFAAKGERVDQVSCPDLAARVGATQRCTLVSGNSTYGVTVTVTRIEGSDVRFDIQVDPKPR